MTESPIDRRARWAMDGAIGAALLVGVVAAFEFPPGARIFPLWVSALGLALWLLRQLARYRRAHAGRDADGAFDATSSSAEFGFLLRFGGWMAGYLAGLALFGFVIATPLFLVGFLRLEATAPWRVVALVTAIGLGLTAALGAALDVYWPRGLFGLALPFL